MRRKLHLHLAALLACAVILAWGPSASFAQGSTGGTLGKTDQSLSGGRPAESPDKGNSAKRSAPGKESSDTSAADGLPRSMHVVEHGAGGIANFSIQLRKTGVKTYEGTWSHGVTTRMTVTAFTKDQVVIQRSDTSGYAGFAPVTGHYSGKRIGNRVSNGTAKISNGWVSSWEASW
jgi:hypothetical protein